MTSDRLNQNDIDSMPKGTRQAASTAATMPDVQVYDFRRPHRVSKERLRTLEAMYERLVKGLEAWLISRIRGQVEVNLQSVEQFSFGEFTLSLPMPCSSYILDIAESGQKGVIDIGPEFSTFIVDRLFGGEGSGAVLTRALTPIERLAVRSIADKVTVLLQEIWKDHITGDLAITGYESSPEILQVINREDPVLVANLQINTESVSSLLLICLPLAVLDKFFASGGQQRLAQPGTSEQEHAITRQRSEATLRATKVPLVARLPEFQIPIRELALLREGCIVPTPIPRDARVLVRAGPQERFIGHAGRVNGNLAVRIVDALFTPQTPDSRNTA